MYFIKIHKYRSHLEILAVSVNTGYIINTAVVVATDDEAAAARLMLNGFGAIHVITDVWRNHKEYY